MTEPADNIIVCRGDAMPWGIDVDAHARDTHQRRSHMTIPRHVSTVLDLFGDDGLDLGEDVRRRPRRSDPRLDDDVEEAEPDPVGLDDDDANDVGDEEVDDIPSLPSARESLDPDAGERHDELPVSAGLGYLPKEFGILPLVRVGASSVVRTAASGNGSAPSPVAGYSPKVP